MRYVPKFNGLIDKGRLILSGEDRFNAYLSSLEGKQVEVIVQIPRKSRSINQNNYYFGIIVTMISEFTGHTIDEVHGFLAGMFLVKHMNILGNETDYVLSSTSLSTTEAENYFSKCREWAALTLQLSVPEPNEGEMR